VRGISPFQRQPSTVYRAQDTSPLIVFDDADQQQAMVHREHSPGAKEVRSDWVWEGPPVVLDIGQEAVLHYDDAVGAVEILQSQRIQTMIAHLQGGSMSL